MKRVTSLHVLLAAALAIIGLQGFNIVRLERMVIDNQAVLEATIQARSAKRDIEMGLMAARIKELEAADASGK